MNPYAKALVLAQSSVHGSNPDLSPVVNEDQLH